MPSSNTFLERLYGAPSRSALPYHFHEMYSRNTPPQSVVVGAVKRLPSFGLSRFSVHTTFKKCSVIAHSLSYQSAVQCALQSQSAFTQRLPRSLTHSHSADAFSCINVLFSCPTKRQSRASSRQSAFTKSHHAPPLMTPCHRKFPRLFFKHLLRSALSRRIPIARAYKAFPEHV